MTDTDDPKSRREITVYLRESHAERSSRWAIVERIAMVLSSVAVPVVLAIVGFAVSARLQDQTAQRDYVTLAVSILQEPDPKKAPPEMKQWAASLLDQNAPTKLPPQLLAKLQSGSAVLPSDGPLVSAGITASPGEIRRGGSARLNWSSTNATTVLITPTVGLVAPSGVIDVSPTETTTYTITVSNHGSWGATSATVSVIDAPANPSN
ncbi:MAG TPA: hypothetical protein VGF28_11275 [Thermoanaerobaculia bacterium]|jgi:uncharacterized repeat protein (TIGR01451 family)